MSAGIKILLPGQFAGLFDDLKMYATDTHTRGNVIIARFTTQNRTIMWCEKWKVKPPLQLNVSKNEDGNFFI